MEREKGDVLHSNAMEAKHFILFLKGHDDTFFIGAMVTHSAEYKNVKNILMDKEHFCTQDSEGNDYKFLFDKTYMVPATLLKPMEWQPFTKVGQLTDQGVDFVESNIGHMIPKLWKDYLALGGRYESAIIIK